MTNFKLNAQPIDSQNSRVLLFDNAGLVAALMTKNESLDLAVCKICDDHNVNHNEPVTVIEKNGNRIYKNFFELSDQITESMIN